MTAIQSPLLAAGFSQVVFYQVKKVTTVDKSKMYNSWTDLGGHHQFAFGIAEPDTILPTTKSYFFGHPGKQFYRFTPNFFTISILSSIPNPGRSGTSTKPSFITKGFASNPFR